MDPTANEALGSFRSERTRPVDSSVVHLRNNQAWVITAKCLPWLEKYTFSNEELLKASDLGECSPFAVHGLNSFPARL